MLVSSNQMRLASSVFNAMLQHKFMEGETLRSDGKVVIPLPDDEPKAFAILMKIVHAQNNTVPTKVHLKTLTDIAILVDKYRLHDCTSIFASMWIDSLSPSISQNTETEGKEIICWLCITWVFGQHSEFEIVTRAAQQYLSYPTLKTVYGPGFDDLPIPETVIGMTVPGTQSPWLTFPQRELKRTGQMRSRMPLQSSKG
jgi:hypothetical protein